MVALFAEAAAEELAAARFGFPAVVTELDLRYLAQTLRTGRSGCRGARCSARGLTRLPVQVELSDRSTGRLTTLVYARSATISD